jgi:DNA-binding beta-propeller fold protein YncE
VVVPVDGQLSDLIFDPTCGFIYATNYNRSRVEIFSMATLTWQNPIATGPFPIALDIRADQQRLYVANKGSVVIRNSASVSQIDLQQRKLIQNFGISDAASPYDIAVAANGTVFVSGWRGSLYTSHLMRINFAVDQFLMLGQGGTTLSASADRRVIGIASEHLTGNWSYRYLSDNNSLTPITRKAGSINALSGDGKVALYGMQVVDMLSPAFASRGVIPAGPDNAGDIILNHTGTVAYQHRPGEKATDHGVIDVIDLTSFKRVKALSVGAPTRSLAQENGIKLSPDGKLLAAITTGGISLLRAEEPSARTTQVTVLSSANGTMHSLLRFYNTGTAAGTATVTLADPTSGARIAVWQSPSVAPGTAPQFDVHAMEATATAPFTKPQRYVATIAATFPGSFAHVSWSPNSAMANLGGCEDRRGPGHYVANVHSSRIPAEYPSEITVMNESASSAPLTISLFNARTSAAVGTYNGGNLGPGMGRTLKISDIEAELQFSPPENLVHYVLKLNSPLEGKLRHLVYHRPTNVLSDLSMVCELPTS